MTLVTEGGKISNNISSPSDTMLFYQCMSIVLSEITIFKDEFFEIIEEMEMSIDDDPIENMKRILSHTELWISSGNESLSNEERMRCLEEFRKKYGDKLL